MQRLVNLTIMLVTFGALATSVGAETDRLITDNRLLRAEYDLARKGQIYLSLSLTDKTFEVRSSGKTIATIPIQEFRSWGPLPQAGMHLVDEKDRVPAREKIKIPPPGGEDSSAKPTPVPPPADAVVEPAKKKFEVQATEVTDMPSNYSLWLKGGGLIVIKSHAVGTDWKSKMLQRIEKPLWSISHALKSDLNHYRKKNYTELTLLMSPLDAQRLYWAVPLGTAILIPVAD